MAETGCLKDGHFQNLQVENTTALTDLEVTGTFQQGRNMVSLTNDTTLDPAAHGVTIAGGTYVSVTGDAQLTLPAGSFLGVVFIIVNDNPDGTGLLTIRPHIGDQFVIDIAGGSGTPMKPIINTKATQKKGDFVKLVGMTANGWMVDSIKGTWIDEP